jgi:hypothetical protein
MSDSASPPQLVLELKVSAHLMQLEAGIYCVYHSPGSAPPDPSTGLPGARVSLPPHQGQGHVVITGFSADGWLGALDSAALIRVEQGPAQVLMTIYQARDSEHEPPRLQVTKLTGGVAVPAQASHGSANPALPPASQTLGEIAAHLQIRGDVLGRLGEWIGDRGSQRWVEGFSVTPHHEAVIPAEIEYQAVLGRGWLSPWAEGGQYCGSRGMALPILGLRVRLRGKAAATHSVEVSATFTDGTTIGPVGPGEPCDAASLAPLEAFCISVVPLGEQRAAASEVASAEPAVVENTPKGKREAPAKGKGRPAAETPATGKSPRGRRS